MSCFYGRKVPLLILAIGDLSYLGKYNYTPLNQCILYTVMSPTARKLTIMVYVDNDSPIKSSTIAPVCKNIHKMCNNL